MDFLDSMEFLGSTEFLNSLEFLDRLEFGMVWLVMVWYILCRKFWNFLEYSKKFHGVWRFEAITVSTQVQTSGI